MNKHGITNIILALSIILSLFGTPVSADETVPSINDITVDLQTELVRISGNTVPLRDNIITLKVFNPQASTAMPADKSTLQCIDSVQTDSFGRFVFSFKLMPRAGVTGGLYSVQINADNTVLNYSFWFAGESDRTAALNGVKNAGNAAALATLLANGSDTVNKLSLSCALFDFADKSALAAKLISATAGGYTWTSANFQKTVWDLCAEVVCESGGAAARINGTAFVDNAMMSGLEAAHNTTVYQLYKTTLNEDNKMKVCANLRGAVFTGNEALFKAFARETVVRLIVQCTTTGAMRAILENNAEYTGIDLSVYSALPDSLKVVAERELIDLSEDLVTVADVNELISYIMAANRFSAEGNVLYVSADGNDENGGLTRETALKTVERAANLAVEYNAFGNVTVVLEEGVYMMNEPIVLYNRHSGREEFPITFKGEGNVELLGGTVLPEGLFKPSGDSRIPPNLYGKIYEADLTAVLPSVDSISADGFRRNTAEGYYYRLYQKGAVQTLARYPNYGYIEIGEVQNAAGTKFSAEIKDFEQALFAGYYAENWWFDYIAGKAQNGNVELMENPTFPTEEGQRFFVFNSIRELDVPGEWYIDSQTGKLYYYPPNGLEDIVLSSQKKPVITLEDAANIIFDNINIKCGRSDGYLLSGSCKNVTIRNSEISRVSGIGINVRNGENVKVENCRIYETGDSGVYLNGGNRYKLTPANNIVEGCDIFEFGKIIKCYAGAVSMEGVGHVIRNNSMHNAVHLAILFDGNDHLIENNEIYNVGQEATDTGAIYAGRDLLGSGTVIRYNYIHDIHSDHPIARNDGWHMGPIAIYLDDMQGGVEVYSNIISDAASALLIGGGQYNTIRDNLIINCDRGITYDDRGRERWFTDYIPTLCNKFVSITSNPQFDVSKWRERFPWIDALATEVAALKNGASYSGILTSKGAVMNNNVTTGINSRRSTASTVTASGNVERQRYIDIEQVKFTDAANQEFSFAADSQIYTEFPAFAAADFSKIGVQEELRSLQNGYEYMYPVQRTASTDVTFLWNRIYGADRYVLRLYDAGGTLLSEHQTKNTFFEMKDMPIGVYMWETEAENVSNKIGETMNSMRSALQVSDSWQAAFTDYRVANSDGKLVSDLYSARGGNVYISAKVNVSADALPQNYTYIVVLMSGNTLKSMMFADVSADGTVTATVPVAENVDNDIRLQLFIWESMNTVKPVIYK